MRSGRLHQVKDGMYMNSKGIHPAFFGDLLQAAGNSAAGRLHKDINTPEIFDNLADKVTAGCGIGNIGREELNCFAIVTGRC